MKQWEYLAGHLSDLSKNGPAISTFGNTSFKPFSELGILGWELVAISDNIAYFKRELVVVGIYNTDISPALSALAEKAAKDILEVIRPDG